MTEQQLKDLLAEMSLEEKIGQMVQLTANFYGTDMLITGPMGSAKIEPEDMKLCGTILGTSGAQKILAHVFRLGKQVLHAGICFQLGMCGRDGSCC